MMKAIQVIYALWFDYSYNSDYPGNIYTYAKAVSCMLVQEMSIKAVKPISTALKCSDI